MPVLSIVIVNYNTVDQLRDCLESILRERGDLDLETLVVDNGSVDGSAAMVRSYAPEITLIDPGRNTWFSGGNNLGIHAAQGDYVLILNPDTIIQPDALQTMLAYLQAHETVGAITCRMEFPSGGVQATCSMRPRYLDLLLGYTFIGVLLSGWRDRRRRRMWYAEWERDSTKAVEVIPGSNILAPRELLLATGAFDEQFRLYFVEDDLCQRIRDTGAEIHFIADALILHHEHASVQQVQRLASRIYFDDLLVYCRKYYGAGRALLLQWLMQPTRLAMDIAQRLRGEKASLQT